MEKTQLFAAVADFYEYSMKNNCDYELWAQFVLSEVKKRVPRGKGVDVACGSGHFTRALKNAGYDVCGIDISAEMLTAAEKECAKQNIYIPFYRGDMTNLRINGKADFITAINDALNCVPTDKLEKTFVSFAKCLNKGGLLFFDISSEYRLKNVIANNTFCEDDEDYSYIWFNKAYADRVEMSMSVFTRDKNYADGGGAVYKKVEASLIEYVHEKNAVLRALAQAGFTIVGISGELGKTYGESAERINFAAIKN